MLAGCQWVGVGLPRPEDYEWRPRLTGIAQPVDVMAGPHGLLYIVERGGRILAADDEGLIPEPMLDVSGLINSSGGEQGLLSLEFHPGAADNGRFFITYTAPDSSLVLAEYMLLRPGVANHRSGQRLLVIEQPFVNHNGGDLVFGPDGFLYLGVGDGGGAGDPSGHAQRQDTLLGKILRLDVDGEPPYSVPASNPFVDDSGARPEIWALGLRNPWGLAFDSDSNSLFVADVGQSSWEEVNRVPLEAGGSNFGWNGFEASHPFSTPVVDWQPPVAEYDHRAGCAVSGGFVVRGGPLPAWEGVYLYGDACSGRIWGLTESRSGRWRGNLLFDTSLRITRFGRGPRGEVLVLDYDDDDGAVYELQAISP